MLARTLAADRVAKALTATVSGQGLAITELQQQMTQQTALAQTGVVRGGLFRGVKWDLKTAADALAYYHSEHFGAPEAREYGKCLPFIPAALWRADGGVAYASLVQNVRLSRDLDGMHAPVLHEL